LIVAPQTQINFQITNHSSYPVCWQIWNLPYRSEEQPSLLLPYLFLSPHCFKKGNNNLDGLINLRYSDPASVANLTQAGKKWPSREAASGTEERQISFEMSDEGTLFYFILFYSCAFTYCY
jgi:hypothetical protein